MTRSDKGISEFAFSWNGIVFDPFHGRTISQDTLKAARCFHEKNEQEAVTRRHDLKKLVQRLSLKSDQLIAMTFNRAYSLLFKNWAASTYIHGLNANEKCIVFPMDDESAKIAEQEGFCFFYDSESKILRSTGTSKVYGDRDFGKHMLYQNAVIRDLLDCGVNVLFQDVDLVWMKDPLPVFLDRPEHVHFMFDGINVRHAPLHANTGFMYFKNQPITRAFWEIVYRRAEQVLSYRSQQEPLNKILGLICKHGLETNILNEQAFVNGHLVKFDTPKGILPIDPYVIHCSWTARIDQKYRKFTDNGLWFLAKPE